MELKTTITKKDYVNAVMATNRKRKFKVILVGVFILPLLMYLIKESMADFWITTVLAMLMYLILILPLVYIISLFKARQQYETNTIFHAPIQYMFSRDAITLTGDSFNSKIAWTAVFRIKEIKNSYLIYHSSAAFLIVLKSAFTAEQDVMFRKLLSSIDSLKNKLQLNKD